MFLSLDLSIKQNKKDSNPFQNLIKIANIIKRSLSHILSQGNKQSKKCSKMIVLLLGLILLR